MLQYALNEWPILERSRLIAGEIGDELNRGDDRPNLTFQVECLPTATPPVIAGEREMQETQAVGTGFPVCTLSLPTAPHHPSWW